LSDSLYSSSVGCLSRVLLSSPTSPKTSSIEYTSDNKLATTTKCLSAVNFRRTHLEFFLDLCVLSCYFETLLAHIENMIGNHEAFLLNTFFLTTLMGSLIFLKGSAVGIRCGLEDCSHGCGIWSAKGFLKLCLTYHQANRHDRFEGETASRHYMTVIIGFYFCLLASQLLIVSVSGYFH
jgi:hypothetical protein